jgi:16S rRNA (cytidine1402-2'-O)-methyltransferase
VDDVTLRALRTLGDVSIIVAADVDRARRLLDSYDITTRLVAVAGVEDALGALEAGDIALVLEGQVLGPSGFHLALVQAAIERGFPVVPVPGPAFPVTALVVSGLPADSFVYLGELPRQAAVRRDLWASVATEHRTLVALESPDRLDDCLPDLCDVLGDRPLVVVRASERGTEIVWRGDADEAVTCQVSFSGDEPCVLVIGGALDEPPPWDEDRLRAEIRGCLEQGLRVKETSQRLAAESGWRRREIYRLATEISRFFRDE